MNKKGFTLIELLIVIAIIAIIAGVVFVALDPLQRFQAARDSQRWTDVSELVSAIKIDQVDNGGYFGPAIYLIATGTSSVVGTNSSGCNTTCTATTTNSICVDMSYLVSEGYMGSIPFDPSTGSTANSDYYLYNGGGVLTIGACDAEGSSAISISR